VEVIKRITFKPAPQGRFRDSLLTMYLTHADGILDLQLHQVVSRGGGGGSVHGIDASPAMIEAARKAARDAGVEDKCTFEGSLVNPTFFGWGPVMGPQAGTGGLTCMHLTP
jgi:hypothetical protein